MRIRYRKQERELKLSKNPKQLSPVNSAKEAKNQGLGFRMCVEGGHYLT